MAMNSVAKVDPSRIDTKKGAIFQQVDADAVKVRPSSSFDTFGVAAAGNANSNIFSVPVGSQDPILSASKTEEDTNIRTQNQFDQEFRVLSAHVYLDPSVTYAEFQQIVERTRIEMKVNKNTFLIDQTVGELVTPYANYVFSAGDNNVAAPTAIVQDLRVLPGNGFGNGVYFDKKHKVVVPKGAPLDTRMYVKSTGAALMSTARKFRFLLKGEAAYDLGA